MGRVAINLDGESHEWCSFWKEDQKCNIGHVNFEMSFRHLSGAVKWSNRLSGSRVQERSQGNINLGNVAIKTNDI